MARPLQIVARALRWRRGTAAIGIEGLYLELAADRARRARVTLEGSDAECALAQSAATLEDAAGALHHAAERYSASERRLARQLAARARELEAIAARFEGAADLTRARRDHQDWETRREKRGI
jgi:hypothetical protein